MKRPITERMAEAKHAMLIERRRRTPRVFFLSPLDHAEFMATEPPTVEFETCVGGSPATLTLPSFEGLAVRQTLAKKPHSTLYSHAGTTKKVREA